MEISPQILEACMLICFGSSWPFAILRTIRTKSVKGKSIVFLGLLFFGYLAGITCKLLGNTDKVLWLYVFNSTMILTEILLYFRFSKSTGRQKSSATNYMHPFRNPVALNAYIAG